MRMIINPLWQKKMIQKIASGESIDETMSFKKSIQWLVVRLETAGRKYEIKNCGEGVKRITSK